MCSPKTMLKIGIAIAVPLALGLIFVPQLRVVIIGFAPFALFALCPLGMLFGMKGMKGMMSDKKGESNEKLLTNNLKAYCNK